jgi:fructoselysine 6-kinase
MRVLGFGDNIVDRFVDRRVLYPGGNCVNVAVYARWLGADSSYLGVFGSDAYGEFLRRSLAAEDVSLAHCVVREGDSGVTDIRVEHGDRVFQGWNGGGVTVTEPIVLDDSLVLYAGSFDLVHSSVYSSSEFELPKLRGSNALVSFDFSADEAHRAAAYLDQVCPAVDLALLSTSELADAEVRDLLVEVVDRGASLALATSGTAGSLLWNGSRFIRGHADLVAPGDIIDTMGCGDAYLAAFAVAMLDSGWSRRTVPSAGAIESCLARAAAFAARQTRVDGAFGHGTPFSLQPKDTIFVGGISPVGQS